MTVKTPKKTPTLNVCSGGKRKEKIQHAEPAKNDKVESQWCEYAEGVQLIKRHDVAFVAALRAPLLPDTQIRS